MPRKAKELSAIEVKRLDHPGRGRNATFAVGGVDGLMLQITPTGAKSWLLRYKAADRRRHLGLGPYPDVTLAAARERAREAREQLWQGIDPIEQRKASKAALVAAQKRGLTFAEAVDAFLKDKVAEFSSDRHAKNYRSTLDLYAIPVIGKMLVDDIGIPDIQRVLQPIWKEKTETARRLRGRIENVLSWATVAGHRSGENPARWKGNLDALLPKPDRVAQTKHRPALALADASSWFADVRSREGMATRALEFAALTAARSGEVRGAVWPEIDTAARMWIIPAERMKMKHEHRVPLTDSTVALLDALDRIEGSNFVFPAVRGGQLSDMSLSACMRRINEARDGGYLDARTGRPAVPHGLRSTFRDWAAETGYPREMAEIALAHNVGSEVERAYRRSDMVERRRGMMATWAGFLRGEGMGQVVRIGA